MSFSYWIDETRVTRHFSEAPAFVEGLGVLLNQDINLLEGTVCDDLGYFVASLFSVEESSLIRETVLNFFAEVTKKRFSDFDELNDFFLTLRDSEFSKIIHQIYRGIRLSDMPLAFREISDELSRRLKCRVRIKDARGYDPRILVRVVRPRSVDFNPPHKDVYLDRLRNALNAFYPIYGCSPSSSLPLVPRSHLLDESQLLRTTEGVMLDGLKYSVPAIVGYTNSVDLKLTRPVVGPSDVLFFSPYLIHGGACNDSEVVRISLEFRFWKVVND